MAGKWRYGLLPLAALWLTANWVETGRIEADLEARARGALDALKIAGVTPRVEGRDISLKGEIASDEARAAALAGVAAVSGARKTEDALARKAPAPEPPAPPAPTTAPADQVKSGQAGKSGDVAPVASPYLFHAETSGGKMTLSGFYPDADSHARIKAAASAGRELVDRTQAGSGAPRDFVEAALAGLDQLARLREGALHLRDRTARLSGEAASAELADDIRAKFIGALPGGFTARSQLTGPAREPASAREKAAGAPPVEKLVAARGPEKPAEKPPGDAAACQARMAALVKARPIVFRAGSARLAPESTATLDAVAAEAKLCPGVAFEVAGHTDDIGYVSENRALSRRRAESVLVYLVAAGVAPRRLTAVGYGERRPLVANDSDDNRAKNRRIEFNLK